MMRSAPARHRLLIVDDNEAIHETCEKSSGHRPRSRKR